MTAFFLILVCFFPVIGFIFVSTLKNKLSFIQCIFSCIIGLVAIIPISFIQSLFAGRNYGDGFFELFVFILITNGIIEECVKLLVLFLFPKDRMNDVSFVFAAVMSGLSLGCFETIIYSIDSPSLIFVRLLTSVILHGVCSGLSCFFIIFLKKNILSFRGIFAAVMIHSLYNFFLYQGGFIRWFSLVCILLGFVKCFVYCKEIEHKENETNFIE